MTLNLLLASFTSLAFFYYGLTCLFSQRMVDEFKRFGLSNQQRIITAIFQLLGAIGIFVGFKYPFIGLVSTGGLSLLMLMGFGVRVKIKDKLKESFPSFAFMVINAYLLYDFYLNHYIK
ncbi:DoxX family protein [Ekhidna sp.]|uniref:DoxX family protein n=1 Tax=Ekhidna sp. TaxID=2608089 RepID=UPI003CCB7B6C